MRRVVALLAFLLVSFSCLAQAPVEVWTDDSSGKSHPTSPSNPIPTTSSGGVVPAVTGFGTLSATNSSALLSTLTTGPNSAAWPTTPGMVYVINAASSAGLLYVCPLGGTCSATNGITIGVNSAYGFYKPATTMTVFAASTATVNAQW